MIKIKFYGSLKRFGTDFQLDCQTVAEALKALMSQLKGLRHMMQQGMYKVRIGSQYLDNRYLEKGLHYRLKEGMTVHFTPVLKGAKRGGVFGVIAGIALIGAAGLFGADDDNVQIFRFDAALPSVFDLRHGQFADGFGVGFQVVVG